MFFKRTIENAGNEYFVLVYVYLHLKYWGYSFMSMSGHIKALQMRHAALEEEINQEVHRPLPNVEKITKLKCKKLKLKEELVSLSA